MRDNYFRTGEGFLCVYAVTMPDSYEQMSSFVEQILKVTEDEEVRVNIVYLYDYIHHIPIADSSSCCW